MLPVPPQLVVLLQVLRLVIRPLLLLLQLLRLLERPLVLRTRTPSTTSATGTTSTTSSSSTTSTASTTSTTSAASATGTTGATRTTSTTSSTSKALVPVPVPALVQVLLVYYVQCRTSTGTRTSDVMLRMILGWRDDQGRSGGSLRNIQNLMDTVARLGPVAAKCFH